jgi:hypothetical protein
MKARDLLKIWRDEIDDITEPYWWTDTEALEYMTDAQNEAARRARLFIDSSTAAVCQYAVRAGTPLVTLDPRVIFVRRAFVASRNPRLQRYSTRDLDGIPGWEAQTGTVTGFITDYESGKLRLFKYPEAEDPQAVPPTQVDTLNLTVVRLPLTGLTHLDDTIEVREQQARGLRHWMSHRAYLKRDSDTYQPEFAKQAEADFAREFGRPSSAVEEEWIERTQQDDDLDGTY